jgi:LemA protein
MELLHMNVPVAVSATLIIVLSGLALGVSGCGYNTIPTLEEQAKAKWGDVQNQYQRRAISSPIWLPPCKAMPSRRKTC